MKQRLTKLLTWLKRRWWIPAGLALIALIFVFSTREQPLAAEIAAVSRGEVRQFLLDEGKTRLDEEYVLTLPVAGEIPRIGLEVGDWVQRGQPILTMRRFAREQDLAGLRAQVREIAARARGIAAQQPTPEDERMARLKIQEAGNQQAQIEQQRAGQEIELAQAERTLARQENLRAEGALPLDQLEQTRKQVDLLRRQIAQTQLQILNARTAVSTAQAALAKLGRNRRDQDYLKDVYAAQSAGISTQQALRQDELQRSVLRAPVSGPVLEIFTPDAGLQPAGAQILRLGDPDTLMVETDLLSEEIHAIKAGQRAEISGKALEDKVVLGSISRIYPSGFTKLSALGVEQQRVKVLVHAPRLALRPGTRVDVRIITAAKKSVLRVPERALFKQDGKWHVFRIDAENRAQLQPVSVGLKNEDWAEISTGLKAGDRIISQLENALKPGVIIDPKTAG
ncbi:MAG: efflux RND transporter periplasmic adaptor subunit [Candidatus Sericytochromatia bacterium]